MSAITRRDFIRGSAAAGAAMACGCSRMGETPRTGRPNVLLIIDDQHNPRAMGHTGETQVATPCLDKLAAESVDFTSGYCSSPVCAPTRHTLYTGLYPAQHGTLYNDVPMREDVPTMMAMLNDAGYTTANIGKMHNAPYHHRRDFQYVLNHEFYVDDAGISHYGPYLRKMLKERGIQAQPWSKAKPGARNWLEHPETIAFTNEWLEEDITAEHWITDETLKFIRDQQTNRPDQPFFVHASYFPPHHPYGPIRKYAEMYDPAEMELPPNFNREMLDRVCTGRNTPAHLSDDEVRYLRARYFAFTTQLDAQIGRLLEGLEALGEAENTIVIFVPDHGDMIGEHGRFYKGVMYEGSARVPFLVRWPGVSRARKEATPVSHADLAPTILRAAGIEPPENLVGDDLRSLLAGEKGWPDRTVYSEYFAQGATSIMARRGPFKIFATAPYGKWERFRFHLFNVEKDPWEMHDLADDSAGDPAHRETFSRMQGELMAIWEKQLADLPDKLPPVMPRSRYDIPWPADPWAAVEPVAAL